MSLFAIGDLHLSLGCNKPMDIFAGWGNYVDRLTENWNNIVKQEDTVVVVGDISWAMKLRDTYKDFEYVNNVLNGQKIFLKGNHDYWWETQAKMNDFLNESKFDKIKMLNNAAFLVNGISICGSRGWINDDGEECNAKVLKREAIRLEISIQEGLKLPGEPVVFIHYPPIFNNQENTYILDVLQKYNISRCFYGHIHGKSVNKAFIGSRDNTEYIIVSADCVDFTPILVKE